MDRKEKDEAYEEEEESFQPLAGPAFCQFDGHSSGMDGGEASNNAEPSAEPADCSLAQACESSAPQPSKQAGISVDEETEVTGFRSSVRTTQLPGVHAAVPALASAATIAAVTGGGEPLRMAAVVSAFIAEADGDLSLQVGQVVVLTKARPDKQWWKGYIRGQPAQIGVFPKLAVVETPEAAEAASALSPPETSTETNAFPSPDPTGRLCS